MMIFSIQQVEEKYFSQWAELYRGYADHYKSPLTNTGLKVTWDWLLDKSHPLIGIVGKQNNILIALAHFRSMPSPLRAHEIGFIDDLFVDPNYRGLRVAEKMIASIKQVGTKNKWHTIRWITRDNNYRARNVYDKVATKSDWNVYELNCE